MAQGRARKWRAAAFGLDLVGRFAAPGLDDGCAPTGALPRVALELVEPSDLPAADAARPLAEQQLPRGSFTIVRAEGDCYRLDHPYYGSFAVTPDGARVACAPAEIEAWLWQRFLVAQPLPLAAALHGYEPLHAGGVVLDDRAVLVMGASGAGKSSLALHLAARGGAFLTDDVAALEPSGTGVVAHQGVPLAMIDERELARIGSAAEAWARLGTVDGEARVVVAESTRRAAPVAAVFVLRSDPAARAIEVGPPAFDRAVVLLGGTFNPYLRDPRRLARQLDVASRLAESASVAEVRIPPGSSASAVADVLARAA